MKFSEYIELFEDVPVGLKNKELWLDYLKEKYSKSKDLDKLYVSFVNVDKIGINPKSPYDTPIGVYTYPLEFVLEEEDVPFRGEIKPKKVKVLKRLSEKVLNDDLTEAELNHYKDILKKQYKIDSVELLEWNNKARKKTPFGKLWNIARMFSLKLSKNKPEKSPKDMTPDELADALSGVNKNPAKNSAVIWNKLLRDLGFDYVQDNGFGIIHPSEPTQAVFLTPKAYKVIDEEFVDTEERFKHTHNKETKDLIEKISKGRWNYHLVEKILEDKKYKFLKITDSDDVLDALDYTIKIDNGILFDKIFKYFLKNNKLENFEFYFKGAIEENYDNENHFKILNKLINLEDERMYSKEISSGYLTKLSIYLKRDLEHSQYVKNRKEIIDRLEDMVK